MSRWVPASSYPRPAPLSQWLPFHQPTRVIQSQALDFRSFFAPRWTNPEIIRSAWLSLAPGNREQFWIHLGSFIDFRCNLDSEGIAAVVIICKPINIGKYGRGQNYLFLVPASSMWQFILDCVPTFLMRKMKPHHGHHSLSSSDNHHVDVSL